MKMATFMHPKLVSFFEVVDGLGEVARDLTIAARRKYRAEHKRRGATLRPGPDAPLWGALSLAIRPLLKPRGQQVLLARFLGVHPARVHEYFIKNSAMPDAERTLLLVQWLAQRRAGLRPG